MPEYVFSKRGNAFIFPESQPQKRIAAQTAARAVTAAAVAAQWASAFNLQQLLQTEVARADMMFRAQRLFMHTTSSRRILETYSTCCSTDGGETRRGLPTKCKASISSRRHLQWAQQNQILLLS